MKQQSTTKGFAILSAASMISKVLSFLYVPFLIYIISDEGFGIYSATYQIYVFIYVLTNSGIPVAISKLLSELFATKNYKDAVKSFKLARFMLLILGLFMSILLVVLAGPLTEITTNTRSKLAVMAVAPTLFFTSILSAYRGYFQGRGNMTPTAISQVIEQVINTIFTLVFAALFLKYGLEAAAAGGTIGTSLGAFVAAIYLIAAYEKNKTIRVSKEDLEANVERYSTKQLIRKIIYYGLPITLCVGFQNAGNLIDVGNIKSRLLVAGFSLADGDVLFGVLTKYRILLSVPIALISALSVAVLPAISSLHALKDKKKVEDKINYAFRLALLVAVPSAIGLAVLSRPVFITIFGIKYADGWRLMLFGSLVIIFQSTVQIQIAILQGIGKLYLSTIYMILGIFSKILLNYYLVAMPRINILGAVFSNMLCFFIPLMLNYRLLNKSLKVKISLFKHFIKPFVSSSIMGVLVFITHRYLERVFELINPGRLATSIATLIAVAIGMYIYIYILIIIGGITKEDLKDMPSKILRFIPKNIKKRIK